MILRTQGSPRNRLKNPGLHLFLFGLLLSTTLMSCTQDTARPEGTQSAQGTQGIALPSQKATGKADVTVNVSSPHMTSQFAPGITYVDSSLDTQAGNNPSAINAATSLIKQALPLQNTHIMAWGAPDPWPDPNQPEPTNWSYLDGRLQLIHNTGGIPVLTLSEAPWWMKGELQADGSTRSLEESDEWTDIAYSSRVLDNQMGAWLHLVQVAAERYMVAPYNVRYFQVWNELKGYYNPATNAYDYTTSPGDPSGSNAKHGYTYMYNQVYDRLMQVAESLHIPTQDIKVGGPYAVMSTWFSTSQSQLSDITKAYGTYDQRPLDVVQYWLQHKDGAGFIALDGTNSNKDNVNSTDPFTAAKKFADLTQWLRSLDPTRYPGATTLPVWFSEWYATSYSTTSNDAYNTAVKTYALIQFLKAGGAVALSWGSDGSTPSDTSIWTPTSKSGGGQPLPFYHVLNTLNDYFSPGTQVYDTRVSVPASVEALASSSHVLLVNKTAKTMTVSIDDKAVVSLQPYQVGVVVRTAI
jgi:hypothetical protein